MARAVTQPPEWFNIRADEPSPWASVRVRAEAVEWFAQLWADPTTNPSMRSVWGSFLSTEAHFREQLPHVDWTTRVTDWELIKFLHVAAGVDQGITECAPELPDLPRGAKARLYYHALLMVSMASAHGNGVAPAAAVRWAVMKALTGAACYAMAEFTQGELRRRIGIAAKETKHVGVYAAALEVFRRAEHLAPVFLIGVAADDVVAGLSRAAKRRTRARLEGLGLNARRIEDFLDGLAGHAAITIAHAWGRDDPLELLARSLHGELDIAPTKIVDRAEDAVNPEIGRQQIEVSFEPRQGDKRDAEQLATSAAWHSEPAASPESAAESRALIDRLAADPVVWRSLLAIENTTYPEDKRRQEDLARRLGRTARTIRNFRKGVEDDIRDS